MSAPLHFTFGDRVSVAWQIQGQPCQISGHVLDEVPWFDGELYYQVRTSDGALVAGDADFPSAPAMAPGEHRFLDAQYLGAPIRVAAFRAPDGTTVH